MKSSTKNMTEGRPAKHIIAFAVPMLLGMLFQQLYNMVDTIIVGKWLGVNALAAVGSVGSINFMIIGFCIGMCIGFAIPVAQTFGAEDYHNLRKYVANGVWLSGAFSLVMTVSVCALCRIILEVMQTPADIIDEAYNYIFVIFLGIPVIFLYNLLSGIIRSLGDSKTPVIFLVVSSVINIILDIVFVKYLHTGVAGPAWATVISQAVSGLLCIWYIYKRFAILHITKDEWSLDGHFIKKLLWMGIPMGLQYSITAIGSVVLQTAVNGLGSMVVASVTAAEKVRIFFCCPIDALGGTMATYAGQNIGAGKPDRVKKGVGSAVAIGGIYAVFAFLVLFFFGKTLALLYLDASETAILNNVQQFLTINALFYFPLASLNIIRFSIQGMGYSGLAVLAGVSEMIARSVVGFVFVPMFGYAAVCSANPAAWIMANILLVPMLFYCVNKKNKEIFGKKLNNT